MRLIKVKDFLSTEDIREEVKEYLREGGAVVYPTDTLYGLGVDIRKVGAVDNLFRLKGRKKGKPIPLFIDEPGRADEIFEGFSPLGKKISSLFWPGKLTIVARAKEEIARIVGSPDRTVGLRLPDSAVAHSLAFLCGGMITGTSANKSGGDFPIHISKVTSDFESEEIFVLDGGDLQPSSGSTVLMIEGNFVRVIREGDLSSIEVLNIVEEFRDG